MRKATRTCAEPRTKHKVKEKGTLKELEEERAIEQMRGS